jgi:hypothetical protein
MKTTHKIAVARVTCHSGRALLPFLNEVFTGVVMLDVLHHVERPIEFLTEASRVRL